MIAASEDEKATSQPRNVPSLAAWIRRLARPDLVVLLVLTAAFTIARVLAVWHRSPGLYPDTDTYRTPPTGLPYDVLSFTGHAPRMWGLPLLYRLLPSERSYMLVQLGASIVAWVALAVVLASVLRNRTLRIVAFAAVLLLGLAPEVAAWDQSLLSESLTISVSIAATAAWLRFAVRPAIPSAVAGLLLTGYLLFLRPFQSPIAVGIALLCVVWALRRSSTRGLKFAVAGVLVALSAWSMVTSGQINDGYRLRGGRGVSYFAEAFQQNLYKRYLKDPGATTWFREHGMPDPAGMTAPSKTGPFQGDFQRGRSFFKQVRSRPEWLHWLDGEAKSALAGYVATHPVHVSREFLKDSPTMIRSAVLPAGNADAIDRVPFETLPAFDFDPFFRGSKDRLWQSDVAALSFVAIALGGFATLRHRRPDWPSLVVGLSVVAVAVGSLFENWLGSAIEVIRHAVPSVTLLRAGLILTVFVLGDACSRTTRNDATPEQSSLPTEPTLPTEPPLPNRGVAVD